MNNIYETRDETYGPVHFDNLELFSTKLKASLKLQTLVEVNLASYPIYEPIITNVLSGLSSVEVMRLRRDFMLQTLVGTLSMDPRSTLTMQNLAKLATAAPIKALGRG